MQNTSFCSDKSLKKINQQTNCPDLHKQKDCSNFAGYFIKIPKI